MRAAEDLWKSINDTVAAGKRERKRRSLIRIEKAKLEALAKQMEVAIDAKDFMRCAALMDKGASADHETAGEALTALIAAACEDPEGQ